MPWQALPASTRGCTRTIRRASVDPWKAFDPDAPPLVNDLSTLGPGIGYWLQMTEPAVLQLGIQPGMSGAETLPTEEGLAHGGPVALANAGLRIPSESAPDIDRLR